VALKLAALAGGVGGAKLLDGLAAVVPPQDLTAVVNTGDDFTHLGLRICPDLDTVLYTLAGVANPATGWGRADETWQFMESLKALGGPAWFQLGDRDLALHALRTERLAKGETLSAFMELVSKALGVAVRILPMSDEPVPTVVETEEGALPFQTYFVARRCEPKVTGFRFEGVERAEPAAGVVQALAAADWVILCPSNPWVSLDPILSVPGIRAAVATRPVIGVSPIVGGQAIKGPAAKMFSELGLTPSPVSVAEHYRDLLTALVIDELDADQAAAIEALGIQTLITQTVMRDADGRAALGRQILELADRLAARETIG
jgi:LPPG:FO 2-phospho-L-lactate transferase